MALLPSSLVPVVAKVGSPRMVAQADVKEERNQLPLTVAVMEDRLDLSSPSPPSSALVKD